MSVLQQDDPTDRDREASDFPGGDLFLADEGGEEKNKDGSKADDERGMAGGGIGDADEEASLIHGDSHRSDKKEQGKFAKFDRFSALPDAPPVNRKHQGGGQNGRRLAATMPGISFRTIFEKMKLAPQNT